MSTAWCSQPACVAVNIRCITAISASGDKATIDVPLSRGDTIMIVSLERDRSRCNQRMSALINGTLRDFEWLWAPSNTSCLTGMHSYFEVVQE